MPSGLSPPIFRFSGAPTNRYASHGRLLEEGKADLYNACEWGNYCRVETSKVGSRQIGRRSIVTFAALVVRGDSPVQTPQQFANRQIGVPFFFGAHYLTLQMLEGFVPREQIKLGRVPNGSAYRFNLLMKGEIEATTLTEPYISLAEKKGCRLVISAFHHGTEVASDRVDAETYSGFNRAVREAVRRINANKRAYLNYFIDYDKHKDPEMPRNHAPNDVALSSSVGKAARAPWIKSLRRYLLPRLLKRGTTVAQGRRKLEQHLAGLNPWGGLTQRMCVLIEDMRRQWCELDRRIAELDKELAEWVRNEETARRSQN